MCWSGLEQIFTQPIKEHLFSWTSRPLQDPVTLMLYLDPSIILPALTPIDPNTDSFGEGGPRVREQMWAPVKFHVCVWAYGKPTFFRTPACQYIVFQRIFL